MGLQEVAQNMALGGLGVARQALVEAIGKLNSLSASSAEDFTPLTEIVIPMRRNILTSQVFPFH